VRVGPSRLCREAFAQEAVIRSTFLGVSEFCPESSIVLACSSRSTGAPSWRDTRPPLDPDKSEDMPCLSLKGKGQRPRGDGGHHNLVGLRATVQRRYQRRRRCPCRTWGRRAAMCTRLERRRSRIYRRRRLLGHSREDRSPRVATWTQTSRPSTIWRHSQRSVRRGRCPRLCFVDRCIAVIALMQQCKAPSSSLSVACSERMLGQ
jgi:hypothetical protein